MSLINQKAVFFVVTVIAMFNVIGCSASNIKYTSHHNEIELYIENNYINSRLMTTDDVDMKSCSNYGDISTTVEGDFDGDGNHDYAFLLVTNIAKKPTLWSGAELFRADIELVALMGTRQKAYKGIVLERLPSYLPSNVFLQLKAPGAIQRSDGSIITLTKQGINRVYCEKSESLFHWLNTEFKQTAISD